MERRVFLRNTSLSGVGLLSGTNIFKSIPNIYSKESMPLTLMGNRFVTLCIMIRTTPWEVSRDVKLHPRDEYNGHTLEGVRAMREAFSYQNPNGRLTWGFTLNALEDQRDHYIDIRKYVVECHHKYGDEITYFPGYFPAMYLPRERVNREITEALQTITGFVGNSYRPQSVIGGFLSSESMEYLAEKEKIHAAHAVIWSQHNIDGGGADGSPSYPFYPSTEHFCKPAQGKNDFIDCVNLDGWTMDFICARQSGANGHSLECYNSRRGIGPIETYLGMGLDFGHYEAMHTQSIHFDKGFDLNKFGWVTNIWEAALVYDTGRDISINEARTLVCEAMKMWVGGTMKRWPDTHFVTFGEFGNIWRDHYRNNDEWDYRFLERGSGLADSYNNLEIKWFMNKEFRLALLRDCFKDGSEYVIDFTRYDLPAHEPKDATPDKPNKDWSLINRINQKGLRTQDKPVLVSELPANDKELISKHYTDFNL